MLLVTLGVGVTLSSSVLFCRSDFRLRAFFVSVGVVAVFGVISSVAFLFVDGVTVVIFVEGAIGDDGDDGTEEAADVGLKLRRVLTSNFRFRSRLKIRNGIKKCS